MRSFGTVSRASPIPEGTLIDVLLDATETRANPAALVCVRRERLPAGAEGKLAAIASGLEKD